VAFQVLFGRVIDPVSGSNKSVQILAVINHNWGWFVGWSLAARRLVGFFSVASGIVANISFDYVVGADRLMNFDDYVHFRQF